MNDVQGLVDTISRVMEAPDDKMSSVVTNSVSTETENWWDE